MKLAKTGASGEAFAGLVRNVQALRGVSALLIIVAHLDPYLSRMPPTAYKAVSIGIAETAIALFFVISGFIMVHTTIDRQMTPWTFLGNRVSRIVPLYWTLTLLVFGVALVAPTLLQATSPDWTALLKSLVFVPFTKANGVTEPILFVGWTLNLEMLFYLLFAAGLAFADRKVGILVGFAFLVCLVIVGPVLLPHGPISQFYTSSIILDFGLGTIVGLISRMVPIDVPIPFKVAAAIMIGLGFTASMVLPSALPDLPLVFACGVPNALIVASAVVLERWGWSIKSALWLLLGNASYSIYLSHPFVTQTVAKMIAPAKTFGITNLSIIMFALIIASVVGIITYYLLEQPMLRITRRLLRRKRPQGQDSVTFRSSELRSRIL